MVKILLFLLLVSLNKTAYGGKELAVTIDDLPFVCGRYLPDVIESDKFRQILKTLQKHKLRVIGFVVGSQINEKNCQLLDEFVVEGHLVGNHTFTHPDLNNTSVERYKSDIIKGENVINKWVGQQKYFRYPYLHQGSTESKYHDISEFLCTGSYINVPVTIDNDDWLFNKQFTDALNRKDSSLADSIGRAYLAHMQEMTYYFDSLATTKFKRDVKHILLVHMNELNSFYLDQLLKWYQAQGWRFITPKEALTDSVYRVQDTYIGTKGLSWLLRF